MPTELTDGFSLAAQIPEDLLSDIFDPSFRQALPGFKRPLGGGRELTLWFKQATLRLLPKPVPFVNPVEAELTFLARLSGEYREATGTINIRTQVTQTTIGEGAAAFVAPVVDFRPNALEAFEVKLDGDASVETWSTAITEAVKPALAAVSPHTAGPLLKDRAAQYLLRTYPDVVFGSGTTAGDGVLAVFVWQDGGSPPIVPRAITPRNLLPKSAVALIPRDRVDAAIEAALRSHGLRNLPAEVNGVTITALRYEWREWGVGRGYFYFAGTADHPLGDVHFEAWIRLWVSSGKVVVNVARTRHNGGFFLDVADLFSGGAITRALEDALPRALAGVGAAAFGDVGLFANGVVPESGEFATFDCTGNVDVWPSGLGIPASLVRRAVTSSFPPPEYLVGHLESREFHSMSCEFGRLIKHGRRFPTWMRAIELGYNGCWFCQRAYNRASVGQLFVEVAGNASPMPQVTARLVSEEERFGVRVRPEPERLDGRFGWSAARQVRRFTTSVLVPGTWEVTVSSEDWSVTTTVKVHNAWRSADGESQGTATRVHAAVGSPEITSELVPSRL